MKQQIRSVAWYLMLATIVFANVFLLYIKLNSEETVLEQGNSHQKNISKRQGKIRKRNPKVQLEVDDFIYKNNSWGQAPIIVEEYKLIFFTQAKVASSDWKKLFRRIAGCSDWADANPHDPSRNGLRYLYHYNQSHANYLLNSPEYTRAIFVRDPKERVLSAYLDKGVDNNFVAEHCCSTTRDRTQECWNRVSNLRFGDFLDLLYTCHNNHWDPQDARVDRKYWKTIDFVGHMETLQQDARLLLEQIGAWDPYGMSGWGKYGNSSMFEKEAKKKVLHATGASERLKQYYTAKLERKAEELYRDDYKNPVLNLTLHKIMTS